MYIARTIDELNRFYSQIANKTSIGFVPTMGALHQGHCALVQASKSANETTIVSIFVNPTQFNQAHDFKNYPITTEADLALLKAHNVDCCFLPTKDMLYPDNYQFRLTENSLSQTMEGTHRPGHFDGVLTVVMKLLQLTRPTNAYFGEKDYQQFQLIQKMAAAFFIPVKIKSCPTVREESGLACSSRNKHLNDAEREIANQFASRFHRGRTLEQIRNTLNTLPLEIDYLTEQNGRRFVAVQIGSTRLIDNYAITNN